MSEDTRLWRLASDRETEGFFNRATAFLRGSPHYPIFLLEICRADERYRPRRTFRQLVTFYPDERYEHLQPEECMELFGEEAERRRGEWLRKLIRILEEFMKTGSLPRIPLTAGEILSMEDMIGNCWSSTFHSWVPHEIRDKGEEAVLSYLQSAIEWVLQHRA